MSDDEQPYLKNARLVPRHVHSFSEDPKIPAKAYDLIRGVVQDSGQIGADTVRYNLHPDFRSPTGNLEWRDKLLLRMRREWPSTLDLPQIAFPRGKRGDSAFFDIDCSMSPLTVEDIKREVQLWTVAGRAVGTYRYQGASLAAHETVIRVEGLKASDVAALSAEVQELLWHNCHDASTFRPHVQDMWALWLQASDGGSTFSGNVDLLCEVKDSKGALCPRVGSVAYSWPGWLIWRQTGRRYLLQYPNRFEYCTTPKCRDLTPKDRHTLLHCPNLVCSTCRGCHLNNNCPIATKEGEKKRRIRSKKGAVASEASASIAPQENLAIGRAKAPPPPPPLAEESISAAPSLAEDFVAPSPAAEPLVRTAESVAKAGSAMDMSDDGLDDAAEGESALLPSGQEVFETHHAPDAGSGEIGASSTAEAVWSEDRAGSSSFAESDTRQSSPLRMGSTTRLAEASASQPVAGSHGGAGGARDFWQALALGRAPSKGGGSAGGTGARGSRGKKK